MSNSKMLIDAAHPEETRVVVLKGNRVEEFDFESSSKKQLRGNIYLAKVTRVEPSLQAAFVEYGGNRHGFLAFSEIHPDYYQIPFADRQALLEEEARAHRDEDDEPREGRGGEGRAEGRGDRGGRRGGDRSNNGGRGETREGRADRTDKEVSGEGRSDRPDRSDRNARGEGRGDRDGRGGRGERGQRRSRRHRRDDAPATALERRDTVDESISEPAFEDEPAVAAGATAEEPRAEAALDSPASGADADADAFPDAVPQGMTARAQDEGRSATVEASAEGTVADIDAAEPVAEPEPLVAAAPAEDARAEGAQAEDAQVEDAQVEAVQAEVTAAAEESYVLEAHADDAPHGAARRDEAVTAPVVGEATDVEAPDGVADLGTAAEASVEAAVEAIVSATAPEARGIPDDREPADAAEQAVEQEDEPVEQIGGDALSDVAPRPVRLRRHYKIQEVIKRRQILLIQVVKEERGNKGAALTTYLSLAGRYSVLMPNTAKGGGISRKITDGEDRKRLKAIANELDVPEGMGVILRTAGASRSPVEVKRDFEYLLRMWESVRELTLKSSAPTLVYEEGSLIKRSIRDLYSKDVEEIVVSGEAGFAEARDFMRMLMPGNVKSVLEYRDPSPIFAKSGVEAQLDAMFSAHVTLKSGGYLVINQTEALVAIDVNSGRSTREHNIEDTALRTNMEAADEVARQLRLRDLAGLIVVDFIDMEEGRNNRAVERRIKEALKNDRARIQIGRISHFGLLEMSRQRIRTGVLEGSTVVCPHCAGAGTVRSTSSIALHVLRLVEDALIKDATYDLVVRSRGEVALYMLNQKRAKLVELEQRFGVTVTVEGDPGLTGTTYHAIGRGELATPAEAPMPRQDRVRVDSIAPIFEPEDEGVPDLAEPEADEARVSGEAVETTEAAAEGEGGERRRKRRRRRRGRDRDGATEFSGDAPQATDGDVAGEPEFGAERPLPVIGFSAEPSGADEVGTDAVTLSVDTAEPVDVPFDRVEAEVGAPAHEILHEPATTDLVEPPVAAAPAGEVGAPAEAKAAAAAEAETAGEAPKRRRSRRTAVRADDEAAVEAPVTEVRATEVQADEPQKRRRRPSRARAAEVEPTETVEPAPAAGAVGEADPVGARPSADRDVGADTVEHHAAPPAASAEVSVDAGTAPAEADAGEGAPAAADPIAPQPDRPKRSGWWQRAKTSFGS